MLVGPLNHWKLWWYREKMASGARVGWLAGLVWHASKGTSGDQYVSLDWSPLGRKWGRECQRAVRAGCKVVWRECEPSLPHERPANEGASNVIIAGLAGLLAGWQDDRANPLVSTILHSPRNFRRPPRRASHMRTDRHS